jgi:hypothetical protein
MCELQIFVMVWCMSGLVSWLSHLKMGWKSLLFHLLLGPVLFMR